MEDFIDFIQSLNLSFLEVLAIVIPIFIVGFLIGSKKVRKLTDEVYSLQRNVLDLNEELLTGHNSSETPVIEIKHEGLKISNIAK